MRFPRLGPAWRLLAVAVLLLAAAPARAALMLAQPPYRPKDFTVVKKDGQFHIFYIRHDVTKPNDQTELDFGHAVSADMYTWTQLPAVIPVRDDSWDNAHVWAPSIVELDSVYYMFYTGVTLRPGAPGVEQRTGLATSTDLMTWNRMDQPVYSCRDVPWAWCDTLNNNNGFRDPFVMPDPANPGHWLMYYVTYSTADLSGMVVGVAASDGDLTQWHDLFPLWFTNEQFSFSTVIESPHVFKHGSLWFMFVTVNANQPISYYTTTDPTGPPGDWSNMRRLSSMIGYDTNSWYASEYFPDGLVDYFAFVNYNRVEIYRMIWSGPDSFHLYEPGNFHVQSLGWSTDHVEAGQNATLKVAATGWANRSVYLVAAEQLPGGGEAAFPIDSLGIPSQLPLTGDTTSFVWPARIFHATGDTTAAETVVLRVFDLTAQAPPITILPPPPPSFEVRGLSWSADSVASGQPVALRVAAVGWNGHTVALQGVEHLAAGGEVAVDLDSLGLPSVLPLTADTTLVAWTARIRRPSGDTTSALDLELRTTDPVVAAPLLRVLPPPPPPPFEVRGLSWSADSVASGQPVALRVAAVSWNGHTVALQGVEHLAAGVEVAVDLDSLGLPSVLPLTADTTLVAWTARIRRPSGDTTSALELELRTTDPVVAAPLLRVLPPLPPPPLIICRLLWSSSLASSGENVTLGIVARGWSGRQAALAVSERLPAGTDSALTIGDLGLPATVPLVADTTRLLWRTRIRRASGDTTTTQVLIFSAIGGPAAPPLTVAPTPVASGGVDDGSPLDKLPHIRRLSRSVLGELPSFVVDMPRAAHVRLDVYDLMGRRVRTVADRDLPVGATVIGWDGRNASGAPAGRGLYFARFVTPSMARTIKIVLTRPVGSP